MAFLPITDARKRAAEAIAKSQWDVAFRQQYPLSTTEQRLASWKANKKHYMKLGIAAIRHLDRRGLAITENKQQ